MLIHKLVNRALTNLRYKVEFEGAELHAGGQATLTVRIAGTRVRYRGDSSSWARLPDQAKPPESMAKILDLYWTRHVQGHPGLAAA